MTRRSDADILLHLIPKDGSAVGNWWLMDQLQSWKESKYWNVRDRLFNAGLIVRGRGKGGSVRRKPQEAELPGARPYRASEADLYDPAMRVLKNEWCKEMLIEEDQIHFEITAKQGKKPTGGTWTRPDITAVSVRTFQHLIGKFFDVWTFEIKALDGLDVTAVFEAAAHASRATRSYALVQIPQDSGPEETDLVDRCIKEAARLRVGLITFTNAEDFSTWETEVEAPRLETAPEALDEFISYLSEKAKSRIAKWK